MDISAYLQKQLEAAKLEANTKPTEDPAVNALIAKALDKIPDIVSNRTLLDEWAALLEIPFQDTAAWKAAKALQQHLCERKVLTELDVPGYPVTRDNSHVLYVHVAALVHAAGVNKP